MPALGRRAELMADIAQKNDVLGIPEALKAMQEAHEMGYRDGLREAATDSGLLPVTEEERLVIKAALVAVHADKVGAGANLVTKLEGLDMPASRPWPTMYTTED